MKRESRTRRFAALADFCITMACACLAAAVLSGCSSTTSYRVLRIFFDGVPNPEEKKAAAAQPGAVPGKAAPSAAFSEHGPYAARLCEACHQKQTNVLIVPKQDLCYRCHDLQLNKKYVHGPLASGGCVVCHDPHSSPYRHLLVAESSTFCLRCHDAGEVSQNPAHQQAGEAQCTDCHDAHMSDHPYLLK